MDRREKDIFILLKNYSFDDVSKSFFALTNYTSNVPSPIKAQYLYTILEFIHPKLETNNRINTYDDFIKFAEQLIPLLPRFTVLEDYLPQGDWGIIKYYFKEREYKIFYGSELSNVYDYFYSFEVVYTALDNKCKDELNRSPIEEFSFCLNLQDYIIHHLPQSSVDTSELKLEQFETPTQEFWNTVNNFIDVFDPTQITNSEKVELFTEDFDSHKPPDSFNIKDFEQKAYEGRNCQYFFYKKNQKLYPLLPRRFFPVLFNCWGELLVSIIDKLKPAFREIQISLGIQLYNFTRERINKRNVFSLINPIDKNTKPYDFDIHCAIHSQDRLFLIHITPPIVKERELNTYLENLTPKIEKALQYISITPNRCGLVLDQLIVEFKSTKANKSLELVFFVVAPRMDTGDFILKIPKNFHHEIIGIEQFLGIIDELKDSDELSDFYDYLVTMHDNAQLTIFSSHLDWFGSYRDSHSILVEGANEPTNIFLVPSYGTDFRYTSLSEFWRKYPEINFFGHPRSWKIEEQIGTDGRIILSSKSFRGFVYYQKVYSTSIFINAPFHLMNYEIGKTTDLMMQIIEDSFAIYKDNLNRLSYFSFKNKLQIFIAPDELVQESKELDHIKHLIPQDSLWGADFVRLKSSHDGMRLVFNRHKISEQLDNANDRSFQISIFLEVLTQINTDRLDKNFTEVVQFLKNEEQKRARFRTKITDKKVAYPEFESIVLPSPREFKLATKLVSQIAKSIGITPGVYSLEKAKKHLNNLISEIIETLDTKVGEFNIVGAIPYLIGKIDALTNRYKFERSSILMSVEHEIDYIPEKRLDERHSEYIQHHKNYRYLIEKFVQHQSKGKKELDSRSLQELLALVNRLLDLYFASDCLEYGILPTEVHINNDFIVDVIYDEIVYEREKQFGEEQAKLRLDVIGNKNDAPYIIKDKDVFARELNSSFMLNFGFEYYSLINFQNVLSAWAYYTNGIEKTVYSATEEEIENLCVQNINPFQKEESKNIIQFLTLDHTTILKTSNNDTDEEDLPVWEYRKRPTRYTLKPLIKINKKYYWGAHSMDDSKGTWLRPLYQYTLPVDLQARPIEKVIVSAHKEIEESLESMIVEIVSRYTQHIQKNFYPHKVDSKISDIGDCDILAYLPKESIILNIESKIINQIYCLKDSKRSREKIFGRIKSNGKFQKGYLQHHEERHNYLTEHTDNVFSLFKVYKPPNNPNIVSIIVTQASFWWTKFPIVKTPMQFVEIKLLSDFIDRLLQRSTD